MEKDEYDWIFDYALQFLESDKFDAAVMDFVDEKCVYFENTEENKFIYSDIHDEFRQHIEVLIASNLGELGLTTELFFESCQKARNRRDINQTVFERLTAIDDFQTFKKVMTKRNIELQIEAMQNTYNDRLQLDTDINGLSHAKDRGGSTANNNSSSSGNHNSNVLRDEMYTSASEKFRRAAREDDDHDAKKTSSSSSSSLSQNRDFEELEADEEKLQDILRQSLLELEILHRQAELEQHQLEQALAMSLAIEEDRLRILILNNNGVNYNKGDFSSRSGIHTGRMGNITGRGDNGGNEYDESYYYEFYTSGRDKNPYRADAKLESKIISQTASPNKTDDDDDYKAISSNGVNTINLNSNNSNIIISTNNRHNSPPMAEVITTQPNQRLNNTASSVADPKQPLPTLNTIKSTHLSNSGISGFKGTALPPINSSSSNNHNTANNIEVEVQLLNEKKKEIQATIQKNQLQLQQQKLTEYQLRNQIQQQSSSISNTVGTNTNSNNDDTQMKMMNEKDAEKRAAYMKQQRDKLIAMKKAEREKKVVEEEERMNRKGVMAATRATERQVEDAVHRLNQQAEKQVDDSFSSSSSPIELENERKRNDVRLALARRMKIDLIQQHQDVERKGLEESKNNSHFVASSSSSSSLSSEQDQQQQQSGSIVNYACFDKRLKEAERTRLENQEKAQLLADKIKLQQQRGVGGGGGRE